MDLYTYVASSNPYQAKSILHKYGYSAKDVRNEKDLGVCLKKLVSYEGEGAFMDVLDSHPDKGVIIEKYLSEQKREYKNADGDCGCSGKKDDTQHTNFIGSGESKSARDLSLIIISASLVIAFAIMSKK